LGLWQSQAPITLKGGNNMAVLEIMHLDSHGNQLYHYRSVRDQTKLAKEEEIGKSGKWKPVTWWPQ